MSDEVNLATEVGLMSLLRSPQSLSEIGEAYRDGSADKDLRSYFIPKYQQDIIDILNRESGKSKGDVVRTIIDEWVALKLRENGGH
jgi:hypothetical protein